jgi:enoyl-CoA hydratase/carnithine racemase
MSDLTDLVVDCPEASIVRMRIARPERRNAMTWETVRQLRKALKEMRSRDDLRVIIFSGDKAAFCAGADFSVFSSMGNFGVQERKQMIDEYMDLAMDLEEHPLPSIAIVRGAAVGGGMELALACDLIVAAPDARFGSVFIRHGLLPDMGGTYRLSRRVGSGHARDLMLTGREVTGTEAAALGLIDRLADDPDLTGLELARELASRSPMSVALIRRLIRSNLDASAKSARFMETLASVVTSGSEEHKTSAWKSRNNT